MRRGRIMPTSCVVEVILDLDQRGGDLDQRRFAGAPSWRRCSPGARSRPARAPRSSPRPSTPSVSPILRSISSCEPSSSTCAAAAAHEDVEHILDLGQVLADRRGHGLHQLHRGRRQASRAPARSPVIDRQQLAEAERGAHRRHARPAAAGARDVIEKVVQQLDRRMLREMRLAVLVQALDLAVGKAEQALDRHAALQAVLAQRLDDGARRPTTAGTPAASRPARTARTAASTSRF
jgi:hypothetical protein